MKKKLLDNCYLLIIVGGMLLPLVVFKYFYSDYLNNLWLIQYYGKYFKIYHDFPLRINAPNIAIGMPNPRFYGYYYYQILGFLSVFIGGARRAVFASLFVLLFGCTKIYLKLFKILFGDKDKTFFQVLPYALTVILIWTPYIFTKMYEDGARGELFGIFLLYICIGLWFISIYEQDKKYLYWTIIGLLIAVLAGTHPITTELGGVFFGVIILITLKHFFAGNESKIKMIGFALLLIALIALISSPWIYTVLTSGALRITEGAKTLSVHLREGDSPLLTRLTIFPYEIGSLYEGTTIMVPYLTLQANIPLLLLFIVSFILLLISSCKKSNKVLSIVFACIYIILLLASTSEMLLPITSKLLYSIQFSYRLITYIDLIALIGTVYNIYIMSNQYSEASIKVLTVAMIVALTICTENAVISEYYAYVLKDKVVGDISSDMAPDYFYWHSDYGNSEYEVNTCSNIIKVDLGLESDGLKPGTITFEITNEDLVDGEVIVETNVIASTYNNLILNDNVIDNSYLYRSGEDRYYFCFRITEPGTYVLSCSENISDIYQQLRTFSYIAFAILLVLMLVIVLAYTVNSKYSGTKIEGQ